MRALFPYAISQGPGDLLEEPLQAGLRHARDEGMCPPGCRVVVLAENLADGPDTLPVLFTRVSCCAVSDSHSAWPELATFVTRFVLRLSGMPVSSCGQNACWLKSFTCFISIQCQGVRRQGLCDPFSGSLSHNHFAAAPHHRTPAAKA